MPLKARGPVIMNHRVYNWTTTKYLKWLYTGT